MGRITIHLGGTGGAPSAPAASDQKTRFADPTGGASSGVQGFSKIGDALEFDALRRFYFQPALLIVDLETLEAQCVVVPAGGPITIGRGPDNQVVIDSDRVSRTHAEVRQRGRAAIGIRDLNSTNGTFVNSMPLEANRDTPLRPGDVALLGSSFLLRTFPLGSSPAHAGESFLFPLWIFLGQAQAEGSAFLRSCQMVSAFEYLARLVAFADRASGASNASIEPLLGKSKLSMGEWVQAARGALTGEGGAPDGPVSRLLRDEAGRPEKPKLLQENLNFAVKWRNENVGHGAPQADHAYRRAYTDLAGRLREVMETYPAFRDSLVVSASTCTVGPGGTYATRVVVHDPVWGLRRPITARRASPLLPGTYLAIPGCEDLVPLGPHMRLASCPECGGQELFLADGFAPTAPFTSPVTNHRASADDLGPEAG
jgi:hypothetical protein